MNDSKPSSETGEWTTVGTPPASSDSDDSSHREILPNERIGRYELLRVLGQGSFGIVYLAHDPQLDRKVALKVPKRNRFKTREQMQAVLDEARTAAKLKHPSLVSVHDVQEHEGLSFIVQEHIEGQNLAEWSRLNQPSFRQIAGIMVEVSEVLAYVHQQGFTHCDLKLSNILMNVQGKAFVADFGLAVHESSQSLRKGEIFGTPSMMAPEQVRGETHRLDGRADIWSVGVILYELLGGRKPFRGSDRRQLYEEILLSDPKPLRQISRRVPRELERICLKCLEKRRTDRYSTMNDLRDDLLAWLDEHSSTLAAEPATTVMATDSPSSTEPAMKIIPKGLRSFDAEDADFFLNLLPGPRDRTGLPESVRFWKNRIEETDADKTFSVGVMYGPSGCGKSSLVKAGLLPLLGSHVFPIYVEATAENTELQILSRLRKQFPHLSADITLADCFGELRRQEDGQQGKVLLVIDQFEQWLHEHSNLKTSPLVDALRQCNGGQLQTLVLVRDDFYLWVNRLFQEIDIQLEEGQNQGVVDLFDPDHARKLLIEFGRAYGKLGDELSAEQEKFVARSVSSLLENDKVICVRLALFADLMKGRPWTIESLQKIGGLGGLGLTFLEETFSAATAPPAHRYHQKAARAVLRALLPESGSLIRACSRSRELLMEVSTYAKRPGDFEALLRILDSELRLITPTSPGGLTVDANDPNTAASEMAGQRHYQLTHDYLVPSLRAWLELEDERTTSGRAARRLRRRAENWQASPENRQLPSLWEAINIEFFTRRSAWTRLERQMMQKTWRHHVSWAAMYLLPVLILAIVIGAGLRVERLVGNLLDASPLATPQAIEDLRTMRWFVVPQLRRKAMDSTQDSAKRLRAAYALAAFERPLTDILVRQLDEVSDDEQQNVYTALAADAEPAKAALAMRYAKRRSSGPGADRIQAAIALLAFSLGELQPAIEMTQLDATPADRAMFIEYLPIWSQWTSESIDVLTDSSLPALQSALCAGLARVKLESLAPNQANRIREVVRNLYHDAKESGTHAAAQHALQSWGETLPATSSARKESPDNTWWVNSVGLTMVRIPGGSFQRVDHSSSEPKATTINVSTFLISHGEVTRAAYGGFQDRELEFEWDADQRVSPTVEHPVNSVSWVDAVQYANWLSRQEGFNEYYEKKDDNRWIPKPGSNGYRLPTDAEWEYACRAGSPAAYCFGDTVDLLARYAIFFDQYRTTIAGNRLPNAWGLFDMHGNLWEWCEEMFNSNQRIIRGGVFDNPAYNARADNRQGLYPLERLNGIGFRVARSIDSSAQ
jgi:serine/threonine protein kinase/formylglycine-generating enzyme required for sulfatase activity